MLAAAKTWAASFLPSAPGHRASRGTKWFGLASRGVSVANVSRHPMPAFVKKWLPLVLQTLLSVALLGWIFRSETFRAQTWQVLTSARPGWLAFGLAAAFLGNLVGVFRWGIFLRVLDIPLSRWEVLRLSFVGLFFNNFLVSAVGGDAVKVVWLGAKGHRKSNALLSVLMDRMSGLGALVLCSVTFIFWRFEWLRRSPVMAGAITFVFLYLFVVVVLMAATFLLAHRGLTPKFPKHPPTQEMIRETSRAYLKFVQEWRQTLVASALSVIILITHFFTFYFSALAFDAAIPLPDFFAIMPAVDIISALPISLGGLGVREQLFIKVLGELYGIPEAQAVSISLGGALITLLCGLVGLVFLPSYRRVTKSPEAA